MKDFTLSQQCALIGLDGLDSLHPSIAKKAVLHAVAIAKLSEDFLPEFETMSSDTFGQKLSDIIKQGRRLSSKKLRTLEKETASLLIADGILEEIPDLLACDMTYYTSGVDIKAYRCTPDCYTSLTEGLRAEFLENGPATTESIFLLWLLRECGCFPDIFSRDEQRILEQHMLNHTTSNALFRILWESEFHSHVESFALSLIHWKKDLLKAPIGQGVNMAFPFFDRRQAVFVDFVIFNTSVADRRTAMINFLIEKGHYVEEVKNGSETLLKIDNAYYRVFPKVVTVSHVPVQGAHLLPVYR